MKLLLRDKHEPLLHEWHTAFADLDGVEMSCGDIFGVTADAIVSPANSFGFMDGGIDLVYSLHFGWDMEARLRAQIRERYGGELPVGMALIVETGNEAIPWLISAPTMRVPMDVSSTANAYLALRAALRAALAHEGTPPIRSVLCPGLGTLCGQMPDARAARQMATAYREVVLGMGDDKGGLAGAVRRHMELVR